MSGSRRRFLSTSAAGVLAPLALPGMQGAGRPNILFILADDLGSGALGCYGNRLVRTPHIDRMAAAGVLFENAFVTTSICAPNRACILAGQHQRTTGVKNFATPFQPAVLAQTYPVLLRKSGYRTGFMGKWGVGANTEKDLELPASNFDYWRGFTDQGSYWYEQNGRKLHENAIVPQRTAEFLDGCKSGQPFCLSISLKAPHGPWQDFDPQFAGLYEGDALPPLPASCTHEIFDRLPAYVRNSLNGGAGSPSSERPPDRMRQGIANYYRLITGVDSIVRNVQEELTRRGLDRNTVILFSSDNGHFAYDKCLSGKWLMYEPSIRVPLIVYDPRSNFRTRRSEMVLTIDIAPSILDFAGVPIPAAIQGRSIKPLLAGSGTPRWRTDWFYEHTFTLAPPKLIAKSQGVRTNDWKYIRYLDPTPHVEELYDLRKDPGEFSDLAGNPRFREVLDRLRARYQAYRRELPDNAPDPAEYAQDRAG